MRLGERENRLYGAYSALSGKYWRGIGMLGFLVITFCSKMLVLIGFGVLVLICIGNEWFRVYKMVVRIGCYYFDGTVL